MTLVLLIRHALTEATGKRLSGRTPGLHLSEAGRAQAERLARTPSRRPARRDLREPARTLHARRPRPVAAGRASTSIEAPELLEVGLRDLDRDVRWPSSRGRSCGSRSSSRRGSIRFPDGESLTEAQRRAVAFLDGLAGRHPKKIVAACAHADVIRLALAHYAGVHVDLFQRLIVSPASVSAVLLGDRIPRIVRMNDTGSLEDLAPRRARPPDAAPASRARGPRAAVGG